MRVSTTIFAIALFGSSSRVHGFAPRFILGNVRCFVDCSSATSWTEDYSFNKAPESEKLPVTLTLVDSFYKINDEDAVRNIVDEISHKCKQEEGCLYISWHEEELVKGIKKIVLKMGFKNGQAVNEHFEDIGWLGKHLREGPATLELIELHGSDQELELAHKSLSKLEGVEVLTFSSSGKYEMLKEHAELLLEE